MPPVLPTPTRGAGDAILRTSSAHAGLMLPTRPRKALLLQKAFSMALLLSLAYAGGKMLSAGG